MDTVDILKQARAVITDPKAWTRGSLVEVNEDGGECYCALGAICKVEFPSLLSDHRDPDKEHDVYFDLNKSAAVAALVGVLPVQYRGPRYSTNTHSVFSFNDHHFDSTDSALAHDGVLAVFDAAINNEMTKASL